MDSSQILSTDYPGILPKFEDWESRKGQFRGFEFHHLGKHGWSSYAQTEPLIRELEHVYCAGAWVATMLVADAVIEMSKVGFKAKHLSQAELLKKHDLYDKAKWVKKRRNHLMHRTRTQKPAVRLHDQTSGRDNLRADAKRAVSIALEISFLPSRSLEAQGVEA